MTLYQIFFITPLYGRCLMGRTFTCIHDTFYRLFFAYYFSDIELIPTHRLEANDRCFSNGESIDQVFASFLSNCSKPDQNSSNREIHLKKQVHPNEFFTAQNNLFVISSSLLHFNRLYKIWVMSLFHKAPLGGVGQHRITSLRRFAWLPIYFLLFVFELKGHLLTFSSWNRIQCSSSPLCYAISEEHRFWRTRRKLHPKSGVGGADTLGNKRKWEEKEKETLGNSSRSMSEMIG